MARQNNKRKADAETSEQPKNKSKAAKEQQQQQQEEEPVEAEEEKTASQLFFERLQEVMQRVGAVGYVAEAGEDEDDDEDDLAELLMMGEGDEDEDNDNDNEDKSEADEKAEGEPDAEAAAEDDDNDEDVEEDEDDEDEDDEEDDIVLGDGREYTEEEIAELRFVLLTEGRTQAIEKMSEVLVGDEDEVNFNTAFSGKIFAAVPKELKKILKAKKDGEKFDQLYGLTKVLADFNTWVNDYDDKKALAAMLKELGAAWKTLLAKSDKDLDIDPEFTRPGVEKMLEKFAEMVALNEENPAFEWK